MRSNVNLEVKEGYTRVSEILSQWDKISGIDQTVLERKRDLGTNVHESIDSFSKGFPSVLTDEEGGKYFSSFLVWNSLKNPTFVETELRLYDDDLKITGCIDAILKFPDSDDIILIDWKTTYNADKLNWPLQASFYLTLLEKVYSKNISKALFVKLDKNGEMPKEYFFEQSEYLKNVCSQALGTYLYQKPWLEKRKFAVTEEYME